MRSLNRLLMPLLCVILLVPTFSRASVELTDTVSTRQNGVNFISGGIGEGQRHSLESAKGNYNLFLTFAMTKSGEYLANIKVQIQDSTGKKLVDTVSSGPLLFAKLPEGKYQVTAELNGMPISRSANISKAGSRELFFYWTHE